MACILVVEDNADLAFGLRMNLEQEDYEVVVVHGGQEAIETARRGGIDLVLLDLMLPDISGFKVIDILRAENIAVPIVVLSARVTESDRVGAFQIGADDYVAKPFSLLELLERVRLRLRTHVRQEPATQKLRIDMGRRECTFRNSHISITRLEFDLLVALVKGAGHVLSKDQLLREVWGLPAGWNTRTVSAHIFSLRRKLEESGCRHAIRTVHGIGVTWIGDAEIFGTP